MGGPQPSGPAARPTLQAPAHQSTAQVRGRVPRVHGDRGMGRRLGSWGPRPCAAPRAEPTEDRSPTWQVSHVPQPTVATATRPLAPQGPAPRRPAHRHVSPTWLRAGHRGQALGGVRCGPCAGLPRGLAAAVLHHLHVSEGHAPLQQVPPAAGRQGVAVVCGAGTKHRRPSLSRGERRSRGPFIPWPSGPQPLWHRGQALPRASDA